MTLLFVIYDWLIEHNIFELHPCCRYTRNSFLRLNDIPLYGYVTFCLFLKCHWVSSS